MKHLYISTILLFFIQVSIGQIQFEHHNILDENENVGKLNEVLNFDLDSDGDKDLIVRAGCKIKWFENLGNNKTFSKAKQIYDCNSPQQLASIDAIAVGDFDGDGDLDIIFDIDYYNIAVLINVDGQGNFSNAQVIEHEHGASEIRVGDFDNDNDLDFISVMGGSSQNIAFHENIDNSGDFIRIEIISFSETNDITDISIVDFDNDGDLDVLYGSYGPSYGFGNIVLIENTNSQGEFLTQVIENQYDKPFFVRSIDLDFDGDNDLLVLRRPSNFQFTWFENVNGAIDTTSESLLVEIDGTNNRLSVELADLDNDNDQDILWASNDMAVWFENLNGLGNFNSETKHITDYSYHNVDYSYDSVLTVFDIDNDSDLDVISASAGDGNGTIYWNENSDGLGNFERVLNISSNIYGLDKTSIVDMDNDGDYDVVTTANSGTYTVENEQLSFSKQMEIVGSNVIYNESSILNECGDVDNDGDNDVISVFHDNSIKWFENNGENEFENNHVILEEGNQSDPDFILLKDLDNDGDLDLITTSFFDAKISWYENLDGLGSFSLEQIIDSSVAGASLIEVNDLNNDGYLDIITSSVNSLIWFPNLDGQGNFGSSITISTEVDNISSISSNDLDQDGDIDVLICDRDDNEISKFINDGTGNFGDEIIINSVLDEPRIAVLSDVDNDNDEDLVIYSYGDQRLIWFENLDGLGNFGAEQLIVQYMQSSSIGEIVPIDFDLDGDNDLVLGYLVSDTDYNSNSKIGWLENIGGTNYNINGQVQLDLDSNGCNASDISIENLLVVTESGSGSMATFTSVNGFYQLFTPIGEYTTSVEQELPSYFNINPSNYTNIITETNNSATSNFCIDINEAANDLNISVYYIDGFPRPGFDISYQLVYKNVGSSQLSGTVTYEYDDAKLQFLNASESVTSQTTNTLTFDYTDLNPFETRTIDLEFNVFTPPTTEIGDELISIATINPISGDETEDDNIFTKEQFVIGSFDPNDIACLEGEQILLEDADKYLHYLIRFQNTGNASAINVRVDNVLDDKLDWTTMQLESLSHDGRVEIIDGSDISFIFDNINLPDSTNDEPNSHGFIAYKIKPKDNVVLGDVFYNTADIYFDFNPPITTNTAATEIIDVLSVNEVENNLFSVYPNPATTELTIKGNFEIEALGIIDINGRVLKQFSNSDQAQRITIDVSELNSGLYFLNIKTDSKEQTVKFVKK